MKTQGKGLYSLIIGFLLITLVGCGSTPQPTVQLTTNIFAKPDLKVGVVYTQPKDKATTHIYGAACLLCYGVASALTSSLDSHLASSVENSELDALKQLVLEGYQGRSENVELVTLSTPINKLKKFKGGLGFAAKDFRPLKKSLGVDVIVVLDISSHGAYRSFSNYIPTSDPQGYVQGLLYAVDLSNNAYIQYMAINERVQPAGDWDEPPTFPTVTTSYYQALENAKDKIKNAI